jgi:glycerol-3-phosphate cytidylyltransferase/D-beta-D-heptose 7-phosphate kinase/D-beta-D-heptose 1-phosphate adenosyltransferase
MKTVVISGYFNPLHGGHLNQIEAARALGDWLVVIVNNDCQQLQKKGKIILDENNRTRLMRALRDVHEVVLSIDEDRTVIKTLEKISKMYPNDELIFANGGDRNSCADIPETEICEKLNIKMVYGVGGSDKLDSSTRIYEDLKGEIE